MVTRQCLDAVDLASARYGRVVALAVAVALNVDQ